LYLESEIGTPGTIQELRWFRNDTGANPSAIGLTEVWLKTVPNGVLTNVDTEDPGTLVATIENIDLGAGNGWFAIDIDDFVFTGGNLLVSFRTQNAPYVAPHSSWRYTATTTNLSRLGNSDTVNPPVMSLSTSRPNIQMLVQATAPTTPPLPAALVSPVNGGWTFMGSTLNWTSTGGFPTSYDVHFGTTPTPAFVQNQTATTYTPVLAPGTTYYWQIVPRNAFGPAANNPVWSFRTPAENQLAESFEATTFPPLGWANPGTFSRSTTTPFHGTASAYKFTSTSVAYVLSTPMLTIAEDSALDFYARTTTANTAQRIQIAYSTDRTTWLPIGDLIELPSNGPWAPYSISLSALAGSNYYIAFQVPALTSTGSVYIDHVFGPEITPVVPSPVTLSAPADAAINVNEYPTLSWTASTTGGIPIGFRVYCDTNPNPSTLIGTATGSPFTPTTALAWNTTYYWKVVPFNAAGEAEGNVIRSFTVRANPTISTFPYSENFGTTGATFPPLNWSRLTGFIGDPLTTTTAGWNSGNWVNVAATPVN
ncbi:MAG: choice-of-anchor J domain-containing protein, partial [Candidatus Cloacimonadaceae bacterium]|nr:choice-of-anchor J domain-containing protein [Candidatus Cloacimonadaceae bacterium]